MVLDLQVDQPHRMPGRARRGGDEFETQRLEPKKHLGVEQRARMNPEKPHRIFPLIAATRVAIIEACGRREGKPAARAQPARPAGHLPLNQGVLPTRVSSTKFSVAASIARPLRPRGG